MSTVTYESPSLPALLIISSFLYLINIAESSFAYLLNAGLVGPLIIGVVFGPQASNLLIDSVQSTFITLGYIGLILLVFEGGLSTDVTLLFSNIVLSVVVALTGIFIPIAISLILLHFGYGYSVLQAFAAGAALCSTSLGTTLSLLKPELRHTRTGTVLMSAALLDDIAGLVIAAIISEISGNSRGSSLVPWQTIVRPILVSLGFAFVTPLVAYVLGQLVHKSTSLPLNWRYGIYLGQVQLLIIVAVLSGFVAGAQYAGTSELFGSYLAGAFLSHIFGTKPSRDIENPDNTASVHQGHSIPRASRWLDPSKLYTPQTAFEHYVLPSLQTLLSPIFFASIGSALPIRSLGSVDGSRRVIWRGLVYSLLMVFGKAIVGMWMLIWPSVRYGWCGSRRKGAGQKKGREKGEDGTARPNLPTDRDIYLNHGQPSEIPSNLNNIDTSVQVPALSRTRSALLLGLAMVARGEIALIVAQLARPILVGSSLETSEPFAVVIWAILLTTVGGAVGVGWLLRK